MVSWWSDPQGNVHHPWVLIGTVAGSARLIGVASLVIDDTQERAVNDPQLCAALIDYLVETGDVRAAGEAKPARA
jgi:hypothetical protein